ncbi:hypothetical protein AB0H73_10925 [Streptomyces olivoreticuli]
MFQFWDGSRSDSDSVYGQLRRGRLSNGAPNRWNPGNWPKLPRRANEPKYYVFLAGGVNPRTHQPLPAGAIGWWTAYGGRFSNHPATCTGAAAAGNGHHAFTRIANKFYEYDIVPHLYPHEATVEDRDAQRFVAEFAPGDRKPLDVWLTRDHYCTFERL